MTVRPATLADAAAIADAQIRCWRWAYEGVLQADFLAGLSPEAKTAEWQDRLQQPQGIWVAEAQGVVQGMIVAAPAHWQNMPVSGMVQTFYIAPEAARQGLGKALWNKAADYLRSQGHDGMYVMVMEANHIGRAFYEKIGGTPHAGDFHIAMDGKPQADCCYYWRF